LRRIAVVRVAQKVGIPLAQIRTALSALPEGRTPTVEDWAALSTRWREDLDNRIDQLAALRDQLSDCIGCGCLTISACRLRNPGDFLGDQGAGARLLER
jgi:MerR family redox-sensitive transcriptional activator SoxR